MKKSEVPQKAGLSDQWHRIAYAVDPDGEYVLVESDGCDSVNISNAQAWELIEDRIAKVRQQVERGELSPLAFYMTAYQMDEALLSQYTSQFRWQVKRHLKPKHFNRLSDKQLQKYADVFEITIDQLLSPPAENNE